MRAYQHVRELFLQFLGPRAQLPVRSFKKSHAVVFRDHLLSEGRTPSTVNTFIKKYLTGPFETARKEGLIDYNPFVAVDALKSTPVAKEIFTPEQVVQLLEVAGGTDWEGAILAGYTTGMRLQDVTNLCWNEVDLQNGLLSFHERKGNKRVLAAFTRISKAGYGLSQDRLGPKRICSRAWQIAPEQAATG